MIGKGWLYGKPGNIEELANILIDKGKDNVIILRDKEISKEGLGYSVVASSGEKGHDIYYDKERGIKRRFGWTKDISGKEKFSENIGTLEMEKLRRTLFGVVMCGNEKIKSEAIQVDWRMMFDLGMDSLSKDVLEFQSHAFESDDTYRKYEHEKLPDLLTSIIPSFDDMILKTAEYEQSSLSKLVEWKNYFETMDFEVESFVQSPLFSVQLFNVSFYAFPSIIKESFWKSGLPAFVTMKYGDKTIEWMREPFDKALSDPDEFLVEMREKYFDAEILEMIKA